jgi:hypothetical protein
MFIRHRLGRRQRRRNATVLDAQRNGHARDRA